jgi:hypothetical protein
MPKLVPALPAPSLVDPEVYDSYVRARYLWDQRTAPAIRAAIGYFEKAVRRDSGYAPAWAGLGNFFAALALTSDARPRKCFPQTREVAARALALDGSLSEAHVARGLVHF